MKNYYANGNLCVQELGSWRLPREVGMRFHASIYATPNGRKQFLEVFRTDSEVPEVRSVVREEALKTAIKYLNETGSPVLIELKQDKKHSSDNGHGA